MYDELIKALHEGAEFLECSTPGIKNSFAKMCHNAADAIEELQKRVPKKPHGRLVDADKLTEEIRLFIKENMLSRDDARELLETIEDAPAVIEAEGKSNE